MDEPIPEDLRIESVEDALIELGFRGLKERLESIPGVDPQGGECGASRVAGKS